MRASASFRFMFLLACTLLLVTCKKEEEPEPEENITGPVAEGGFHWKAGSNGMVSADSAYYYSQFTTIYAFKNGLNNSIEVNLSSVSAGSYSLSSATGNILTFVTNATTYTASSGSFNITSVVSSKLSGDFSATLSGGPLTSLSGTFSAIQQR